MTLHTVFISKATVCSCHCCQLGSTADLDERGKEHGNVADEFGGCRYLQRCKTTVYFSICNSENKDQNLNRIKRYINLRYSDNVAVNVVRGGQMIRTV